jgi:hypothetical protein
MWNCDVELRSLTLGIGSSRGETYLQEVPEKATERILTKTANGNR